jgi:hypothetical protein
MPVRCSLLGWIAITSAVACGDSSTTSAPGSSPEAGPETDSERNWRQLLDEPDLERMLARARPWMTDQQVPDDFSALRTRQPGQEIAREWAKRHLTWGAVATTDVLDPAEQLRHWTSASGGRLGCVSGQIDSVAEREGAVDFRLRHRSGHLSGGFIVGEGDVEAGDAATVCGIVVGRLMRGHAVGLFVVGLVRPLAGRGADDPGAAGSATAPPDGAGRTPPGAQWLPPRRE